MTDNNKNTKKTKPLFSGKLKYGASAVVFTLVFIIFIVVLNVALSVVEENTGSLTIDVTNDEIFTITDKSVAALSAVDKEIEIIFCQPEDKIVSDEILNYARVIAEDYTDHFDNIKLVYKDIVSNPSYFKAFQESTLDVITYDSVIVSCKTTGLYRVLNARQMTVYYNNAPYAFNGEDKFTTAMLTVARNEEDAFRAGIVSGHGENEDHNIRHFLEEYGYEVVSPLDLKTISQQELAEYDLLIINNPQSDFFGQENPAVNEITKLTLYVQGDFGNVMMFFDPYTKAETPNLDEFLDTFGLSVDRVPVTDTKAGNKSGLAGDYSFFGTYSSFAPKDDDNIDDGYNIHSPISTSGSGLRPIFSSSCYIKINEGLVNNLRVYPVVVTSSDGTAFVDENEVNNGNPGSVPLITVSNYSRLIPGQDQFSAKVMVCGSTGFIDQLGNSAVANTELFRRMLVATGNDTIATDIDYKIFDDQTIITNEEINSSMIFYLVVLVPVIIVIAGIAVFVKRKYF